MFSKSLKLEEIKEAGSFSTINLRINGFARELFLDRLMKLQRWYSNCYLVHLNPETVSIKAVTLKTCSFCHASIQLTLCIAVKKKNSVRIPVIFNVHIIWEDTI